MALFADMPTFPRGKRGGVKMVTDRGRMKFISTLNGVLKMHLIYILHAKENRKSITREGTIVNEVSSIIVRTRLIILKN